MKLKILQAPNEILLKESVDVKNVNKKIQKLMLNMAETMYKSRGIGLAAPQVGENLNIFVMDLQDKKNPDEKSDLYFIVNPKFVYKSPEKIIFNEGCLSVEEGGKRIAVERHKNVIIEYLDFHGNKQKLQSTSDLMAVCIQHEYDHLLGKTIEESGLGYELKEE